MDKNITRRDFIKVTGAAGVLITGLASGTTSCTLTGNRTREYEKKAEELVAQMTLKEKVSQLLYNAPAIERLDIPEYNWWNECLHGVARAGIATVFPQAIGLAATWDQDLIFRIGSAISDEARAKYHDFVSKGKRGIYQGLTFWSPNINIFRDPRWGRGMETYGEDPFLTGSIGVSFVKGLQGDDPDYLKTVATVKHFAVHSGPEPDRHHFNALVNERDLRETYLPHFKMCVIDGGAYSVMGAYNRFRGESCSASYLLLQQILRNEWGFNGYVVSDCWAIKDIYEFHEIVETPAEAAALGVKAGCDLNCGVTYRHLLEAVDEGHITEEEIDVSVRRLFTARFRLGMFDPPEKVKYTGIPYSVVDCEEHKQLTLEAARKSIVLLKNDGDILPLKKNIGRIGVIGPNADDVEVLLGNYNGIPSDPITPLRGIIEKVKGLSEVEYTTGCEWADNMPLLDLVPSEVLYTSDDLSETGLTGEYFDNREFKGEPVVTAVDSKIDFYWWDKGPQENIDSDNFSVRWTGVLVPKVTGEYMFGGEGFSEFRIYINGEEIVRFRGSHHSRKTYRPIRLTAGRKYRLSVEFIEHAGDAFMKLLWKRPGRDLKKEAIEIAQRSDAVIMFMGLSPRLEGEEMDVPVKGFSGGDRIDIGLPEIQEDLIRTIHGTGKPVILVLLNGSALSINWADEKIPAIIEAWYPGQAAGSAIADVIFGDYNPSGRLPVTFYKSADHLPPFDDYDMEGRTYRYFKGEALYPFGHGLSYTRFSYNDLRLPETVDMNSRDFSVSVKVKNTGERAGGEIVQLYLTDIEASVPVPVRTLKAIRHILLEPGEEKTVEFKIKTEDLALFDKDFDRIIEPGLFEISVGGKQPGFSGNADAGSTEAVSGRLEVK
ncbi:glycoside hydrolase family 3 C-terminal domain-containing protein [candidate division KSB1 bacterium]